MKQPCCRVSFSNALLTTIVTEDMEKEVKCELLFDFANAVTVSAYNYPKLLLCGSDIIVYDTEADYILSDDSYDSVQKVYPFSK